MDVFSKSFGLNFEDEGGNLLTFTALSFYRSQNALCSVGPNIFSQPKNLSAFKLVSSALPRNFYGTAYKTRPALNILGLVKGQGNSI